jgi:hypothetical protein
VKTHNITIRMGAAYDTVSVNGTDFDRSIMSRRDKSELRNRLVGVLEREGYFANA